MNRREALRGFLAMPVAARFAPFVRPAQPTRVYRFVAAERINKGELVAIGADGRVRRALPTVMIRTGAPDVAGLSVFVETAESRAAKARMFSVLGNGLRRSGGC